MIHGIDRFRDFRHHQDQYVLIGGSACDLLFSEIGESFRVTKDLDMVLLIENLTAEFGETFWAFINAGGYRYRQGNSDVPQYYRFEKPMNRDFPHMIELFTRHAAPSDARSRRMPIFIDNHVASLSAILLSDGYYELLCCEKRIVSDLVILKPEILIVLKAKAFLDLAPRGTRGEAGLGAEAKKHLKDIVRLTALLSGQERVELPDFVLNDLLRCRAYYLAHPYNPMQLNLPRQAADIVGILDAVFQLPAPD